MSDNLKTEIEVLKTEMKNIAKKVDEGFKLNSEEHKELVKTFQDAMEKKAGKWVEKVLVGVGTLILTAIVGALMTLILK